MDFYRVIGLEKEPFSTSPDPDFLYLTHEHDLALTNLLIELRLRRGLSVILGEIGTGKTTLSRKLITELGDREGFVVHSVLNPAFESEKHFLISLIQNFQVPLDDGMVLNDMTLAEMRDAFEKYLFKAGTEEGKIVTLIIDEAQKLSIETLEALRILLNYETNEFKLLQIVLLGQLEFYSKLLKVQNFYDRIDFKFTLNPLGFEMAKRMIEFRVKQAGYNKNRALFDEEAMHEIYTYTKGYPRVMIKICHNCLRELLVDGNKEHVDREIASKAIRKDKAAKWQEKAAQQNTSY